MSYMHNQNVFDRLLSVNISSSAGPEVRSAVNFIGGSPGALRAHLRSREIGSDTREDDRFGQKISNQPSAFTKLRLRPHKE